jgi:hypothetical protein
MTYGKIIPRTPTTKYHDSKRKGVIHIDMCSPIKNDQQVKKRKMDQTLRILRVKNMDLK